MRFSVLIFVYFLFFALVSLVSAKGRGNTGCGGSYRRNNRVSVIYAPKHSVTVAPAKTGSRSAFWKDKFGSAVRIAKGPVGKIVGEAAVIGGVAAAVHAVSNAAAGNADPIVIKLDIPTTPGQPQLDEQSPMPSDLPIVFYWTQPTPPSLPPSTTTPSTTTVKDNDHHLIVVISVAGGVASSSLVILIAVFFLVRKQKGKITEISSEN